MKKSWAILLLAIMFSFTLSTSSLAFLIDTGPGPNEDGGAALCNIGGEFQYLAAGFSLSLPSTITSIEGWIAPYGNGNLSVKIYNGGGYIPGTLVNFKDFSLIASGSSPAWYGPSGLNWNLDAGAYWVAFEPKNGFDGAMPNPSISPLEKEAFFYSGYSGYYGTDMNIGVRIDGSQVPLPGAVWLLGSGLLGLVGWRRFRKS